MTTPCRLSTAAFHSWTPSLHLQTVDAPSCGDKGSPPTMASARTAEKTCLDSSSIFGTPDRCSDCSENTVSNSSSIVVCLFRRLPNQSRCLQTDYLATAAKELFRRSCSATGVYAGRNSAYGWGPMLQADKQRHWIFRVTLQPHCGPGIDSEFIRNK
jgi:hypothetical protein